MASAPPSPVLLRPHQRADLAFFLAWYADPEVARLIRHDRTPLSPEEIRRYFEDTLLALSAAGHGFAIVEAESDRLLGTCSLTDFSTDGHEAILRILIGPRTHWGKGYGTAALRLLLTYGFEVLCLRTVRLHVFADNPRAVRAYLKLGFQVVARFPLLGPQQPAGAEELTMRLEAPVFRARSLASPP